MRNTAKPMRKLHLALVTPRTVIGTVDTKGPPRRRPACLAWPPHLAPAYIGFIGVPAWLRGVIG